MKESILKLENISKHFLNVAALSNVNIEFYPGEVNALIGSNGAGKSTLINVIAGLIPFSKGKLYFDGRQVQWKSPYEAQKAGVAVCTQEIQVFNHLTIQENLWIGNVRLEKIRMSHREKKEMTKAVLEKLELSLQPQQKMGQLSLAEKFLLQFARTLLTEPRLIIIDELTDVLTQIECERIYSLIEELKEKKVSVIFITHRLEEAMRIADRLTVLRDGAVIDIIDTKEAQRDRLAQEILGQDRKEYFPKLPVKKGEVLLRVNNISNKFLDHISFTLSRGEILGVAGLVGSGRSSLLKAIVGLDEVETGEIIMENTRLGRYQRKIHESVGYMPENRDSWGLFPNLSIAQNITIKNLKKVKRFCAIRPQMETMVSKDAMDRLGVSWKHLDRKVIYLSGGNKQKLLVARNLFAKCNIYVFDEPTKGIDTSGKVEIYNIINELVRKGAGIILVSSDFSELAGMCDRLLAIKKGRLCAELTQKETTQLRLYTLFREDKSLQNTAEI